MRIVATRNLKEGDVVGKDLYDENGHVLLHAGVELTADYIRAVAAKGFTRIYVQDADEPIAVEFDDDLSPETRAHSLRVLREAYDGIENELGVVRDSSNRDIRAAIRSDTFKSLLGSDAVLGSLEAAVGEILDEVLTRSVLAGLTSLKTEDAQLYQHSIDVCVVALMIAKSIGQPSIRMRQLAMGCLLHDVGMMFVKEDVPEDLRIRQHTRLGFEMLKSCPDPDILAPRVALEHHEHQDGSGLPRGLSGSNTVARDRSRKPPIPTLIGEITAVANTYDSLLSGTAARKPLSTEEALRVMRGVAGRILNEELVREFVRIVPVYPLGTKVVVTSGEFRHFLGVVLKVNSDKLDRPIIALARDANGAPIEPIEIDLKENPDILIRAQLGT